jgi:U3 small nucleolar ribonucleoprotein protein IMP4
MPLQNPHLIFHNFNTQLGIRVTNILKHLFPPGTKEDSRRIVTFANNNDFISFRCVQHSPSKPRKKNKTKHLSVS